MPWRASQERHDPPPSVNTMPLAYDVPFAVHAPAHPTQPGRAHAQSIKGKAHAPAKGKKAAKSPARRTKTVIVHAGDTVYALARTHHSSVAAIAKANPRIEFRRLVPGTKLKVPVSARTSAKAAPTPRKTASHKATKARGAAKTARPAKKKTARTPARTTKIVVVHPGDSLYTIAQRSHASLAAVIKANPRLDARHLHVGTLVKVPVAAARPAGAVKSGRPSKPHKPARSSKSHAHAPKPTHVIVYAGTAAGRRYPASVVASGDRHRRQLAQAQLPSQAQIRSMITATAKRYGVNPTLALGIAWQESGHRQSAVSVCDALGTMQVMPQTGQWAGSLIGRKLDLMKTQDNITAGVVTLRFLTQHAANQDEVIGAYYQGLGAVRAHGFYPDTRHYVSSVKAHMKRFSH